MSERIRKAIEEHYFDGEEKQPNGRVTISMGLFTCMNGSLTEEEMIKQADNNLYKAKATGRNNIKSSVVINKNMGPIEIFDK